VSPEWSFAINELLERVQAAVVAGGLTKEHAEEIELHAPLEQRREPLVIDQRSEAILRERLCSWPA
jgi:hypothetical protein